MANGGSAHAVAALVFAVHESNCIAGGSGTQRALTLVSAATAAAAATDDVDSDSMSDSSGNGCNGSKQYGVAIQSVLFLTLQERAVHRVALISHAAQLTL
eukprot:16021-Heterococcus_DN1.PRE.1